MVKEASPLDMPALVTIHNANKCTVNNRDCFVVCLLDSRGNLVFYRSLGRYDAEAVQEFTTMALALEAAKDLARRKNVRTIRLDDEKKLMTYEEE